MRQFVALTVAAAFAVTFCEVLASEPTPKMGALGDSTVSYFDGTEKFLLHVDRTRLAIRFVRGTSEQRMKAVMDRFAMSAEKHSVRAYDYVFARGRVTDQLAAALRAVPEVEYVGFVFLSSYEDDYTPGNRISVKFTPAPRDSLDAMLAKLRLSWNGRTDDLGWSLVELPWSNAPRIFDLAKDLMQSRYVTFAGPDFLSTVEPDAHNFGPGPDLGPKDPDNPAPGEFVAIEEMPVLVSMPRPVYPESARASKIEGVVIVKALIGRDGSVKKTFVSKGDSFPLLDAAAEDAVMKARFKPAVQAGKPVAVWLAIPVRFRLD